MVNLPFAQAAEENKRFIFDAVRSYLKGNVLEIGSGTGQHAVYFASLLPELCWQTSDLEASLAGIGARIDHSGLDNLPPPLQLDALGDWPDSCYDTVYTANSFHIMGAAAVALCIESVGACLQPGGHFIIYGPFNYNGAYTSPSNERFDAMLRAHDPASGIRDFEWLEQLAQQANLVLEADIAMPANNRSLVWKKRTL